MKLKLLLLPILPLFLSCISTWSENKSVSWAATNNDKTIAVKDSLIPAMTDTILLKDINNDRVDDTAFVFTPPTFATLDEKGEVEFQAGCADNDCYNKITFSCKLPELLYKESVWGKVENAGDLNGDGISELLFEPSWFTSSLGHIYLYTLKNGKWEVVTSAEHRNTGEELKPNLIKKGKKYFLKGIHYWDDDTPYEVEIKFKK